MDIPQNLKDAIGKITAVEHSKIVEESQIISKKYRENDGKGKKLVTKKSEVIAYAISRMPATYVAVYSALKHTLENYENEISTVLDVGAGTGTATWAIEELLDSQKITCLEREEEMLKIGRKLMERNFSNVKWKKFDLVNDDILEKADLVVASYVINELTKDDRKKAIEKMWNATNEILLLIEPGTPEGFKHILEAREKLLSRGAHIVAPCVHNFECPIAKDDWCAFYARVARSGMQRQAKKGELGYEDEKFSYIAFSKMPMEQLSNKQDVSRILRHPQINQGHVKVKICTVDGIQEKIYSKKDGEIYKRIRKLDAGERI